MASDSNAMRIVTAMAFLMRSGDLGCWLSPRLMRRLKAFASRQDGDAIKNVSDEVDDTIFLSWLEQVGSMEPNVQWEVESLLSNGGIYKILLKGDKKDESQNGTT